MAIEKRTLEIDGYTYEVTQLDAIKGRRAFVRLANTLGPAFRHAASEKEAVGNILSNLKEAELDHFCDLFSELTTVTGNEFEDRSPQLKGRVFMEHFAGRYGAMVEWLVFCVEVNFSSFFSDVERIVAKYTPAPKVTESPST